MSETHVEFRYRHPRDGESVICLEALDMSDHIYRTIQQGGSFYELDLLQYLDAMFRRAGRPAVIDVGANIGNHSVFFAKYLASHVIAVEPNAAVLPVLKRNLVRNVERSSAWSVVACALGATEGVGVIEPSATEAGNVGMAKVRQLPTMDMPPGAVAITTLDKLVNHYYQTGRLVAPVGLVKIDVEGMEVDVLKGARILIERFAPDLVVEAKNKVEKAMVEEVLDSYGYAAVSRHCATPTYHYVCRPSHWTRLSARLHLMRSWFRQHASNFITGALSTTTVSHRR